MLVLYWACAETVVVPMVFSAIADHRNELPLGDDSCEDHVIFPSQDFLNSWRARNMGGRNVATTSHHTAAMKPCRDMLRPILSSWMVRGVTYRHGSSVLHPVRMMCRQAIISGTPVIDPNLGES